MLRFFIAPLFWAGIILFLSSIPAKDLPELTFWDLIRSDKLGHIFMYGILAFQLMRSLVRQYSSWQLRYYATVIAFIISVMYGGLIEVYQHYLIADRFGDWIDFLANIIGTFLGVVAFRFIFKEYLR